MARKKRAEEEINPNEWLNTYADMVTLLLCFFVLLYTASTPDEAKFQWILQAFQNNGQFVNMVVAQDPPDILSEPKDGNEDFPPISDTEGTDPSIGQMPMSFDQLFNWISESVDANNLSSSVSVSQSAGRIYIRFDSDVMFAPNSYKITPAGENMLNKIYPGIRAVKKYVKTVEVSGHTADVGNLFGGINDWELSSMRGATVTTYLDYWAKMVEHSKFKTSGYAETQPYYPNDTEEGRAKNRRVELVVIRNDYALNDTAIVSDVLKYDFNLMPTPGGPDDTRNQQPGNFDKSTQIMEAIYDKYNIRPEDRENADGGDVTTPDFGPTIPGLPVITPDMLEPTATTDAGGGAAQTDTAKPDSGGGTSAETSEPEE